MTLDRHLIRNVQRPDLVFSHGQGSWLEDETGKRHLDLVQGWAVNSLGHCHPAIVEALTQHSQRLICPSPAFHNRPMLALCERLAQLSGLERVFLASTGAEANEGAVKLARRWGRTHKGGANEVITFDNSFHGRSLAMMAASGKPGWDTIFAPMPLGFVKATLNDLKSVERVLSERTVAIMLEPVQGEGGVHVVEGRFMHALRQLADDHRVLLILDEVQTGVGRCGMAFAHQHFGVMPDVMTLAKGLGGGVPLSALLCREAFDCFEPGDQGGTYTGNPLMAAVGLAVVNRVCESAFLAQVQQRAEQLSEGLRRLSAEYQLGEERGLGLLRALVLPRPQAAAVVEAARALTPHGLLINAPRPNVLRFMPALNISAAEVDEGLRLLSRAFDQVVANLA